MIIKNRFIQFFHRVDSLMKINDLNIKIIAAEIHKITKPYGQILFLCDLQYP